MYDAGTRPEGYLRAYAREFGSVEVDSTFYGTPPSGRLERWAAQVPADFTFALKLPRALTHDARLLGPRAEPEAFADAAAALGERLEAILIQLPPDFGPHEFAALAAFVGDLPAGPRWALEVRDQAWFEEPVRSRFRAALEERSVALAVTDGPFVPLDVMLDELRAPTAPHAYLRWLGRRETVVRFDSVVLDRSAPLARWVAALRDAAPRLTRVSGYANNHYAGHSPATIRDVYAALGIAHTRPARIEQRSLFE